MATIEGDEVEFRDPPPKGSPSGSAWVTVLLPLTKQGAVKRWAMVRSFDSPLAASSAQSNLTGRAVKIPFPDHDWIFSARGCELFAIYQGKTRPRESPGRAKRKR